MKCRSWEAEARAERLEPGISWNSKTIFDMVDLTGFVVPNPVQQWLFGIQAEWWFGF